MSVRDLVAITCLLVCVLVGPLAAAFAPPPCTTDEECLGDELGYFNMCQIEPDEDEGFCTVDFPPCSSDQECLDQDYDSCDETLGECTWEWWGEPSYDDACATDEDCAGEAVCVASDSGDPECVTPPVDAPDGSDAPTQCETDEECMGDGYEVCDASGICQDGDDNENWCESDADCPNGLVCWEFSSDSSCVSVGGDTSGCHGGQSPHGLLALLGGLALLVTRRGRAILACTAGGCSP